MRMLPFTLRGGQGLPIITLHWLSGSSLTWTEVGNGLVERGARCAAMDLPGFGEAAEFSDFTVAAMVEQAIATIGAITGETGSASWFLMGHSMGGKLAAIIAHAALAGDERLRGLAGIILVSPSPPGPEPMKERQRQHLLDQLGESTHDLTEDRSRAQAFIEDNVGKLPLSEDIRDRSIQDVLRMSRAAFAAWLTTGSKEDWSKHVGMLTFPTLVLAGTEESALGPDAQRTHTLPHFKDVRLVSLIGGGHLAPLERPAELVDRIVDFIEDLGYPLRPESKILGPDFSALIASDSTSAKTREVLDARVQDNLLPRAAYVLDIECRLALRALTNRVVPGCKFDLSDRIHRSLSQGIRNGWRHDLLPRDLDVWRKGLKSFDIVAVQNFGVPFVALDAARQDELLSKARDGKLSKGLLGTLHLDHSSDALSATEMQAWFEDVRGELTRLYMTDPRTMEQIGFTGFADEHGFTQITLDSNEEATT